MGARVPSEDPLLRTHGIVDSLVDLVNVTAGAVVLHEVAEGVARLIR